MESAGFEQLEPAGFKQKFITLDSIAASKFSHALARCGAEQTSSSDTAAEAGTGDLARAAADAAETEADIVARVVGQVRRRLGSE